MRVLLDENLPVDLAAEIIGHEVATVRSLGWEGVKNSELLRRAERRFQVFVTMDRNLEFQQDISVLRLGVVLVRAPSNRMIHLRPLVPLILAALEEVEPGELRSVGA